MLFDSETYFYTAGRLRIMASLPKALDCGAHDQDPGHQEAVPSFQDFQI
jgi:hypothetical protein